MMKTRTYLFLIIIIALVLRLVYFKNITFFYDQARDAIASIEIWQGHPIKVLGPPTDIIGLYHGPLYWYLTSSIYFFSHGNVFQVKLFFITLSLISLFFVYDTTWMIFKKREISLLATFIYAISFEAVQYARWLSNPSPALITSLVSFWSLQKLIQNRKWAIIPLFISYAMSIQFQLFLIYQIFVFVIIWFLVKGNKLPTSSKKDWGVALAGFFVTISTYIVAEIKFNFRGINALFNFIKTQTLFGSTFTDILIKYINNLVNSSYLNIWGINLFLAGLATITIIFFTVHDINKNTNKKGLIFLLLWFLSSVMISFFEAPNANFVSLGILPSIIIIFAYFLYKLAKRNKILFYSAMAVIIFGNLNLIISKNKDGEVLFTVQKQMLLSDELKTIDWIYGEAQGKSFYLNTITNPLFINTLWAELFSWHGKEKFGYMPIWWGETQVDVPGSKIKFADSSPTDLHFLIIEPAARNDDDYTNGIIALENTRSEIVKTERIGAFTIQERRVTRSRIFTSQDVFYYVKNTDVGKLRNNQ